MRQFSEPYGKVGTYRLEWRAYSEKKPKSCGYLTDWTPAFSGEMERVWQPIENRFPSAIKAVKDGVITSKPQLLIVLKRMAAVHHLRSFRTRYLGQFAADKALADSLGRLTTNDAVVEYLSSEFRTRNGTDPTSEADLRAALVDIAKEDASWDPVLNFRKKMDESFVDFKKIFEACDIEILKAPADRCFILGDTPVDLDVPNLRRRDVHPDARPLFEAHTVWFPIHKDYCLRFPAKRTDYVSIGGREVDKINKRQMTNAYRYVYFNPDVHVHRFVEEKASSWRVAVHPGWVNVVDHHPSG
ncbi:MAG: DUF4238 domain-containing protein [Micromonosporaceae bacterium]|nr:DUF4238 domain-containing protein [Micromonosporaceae bacterium]